MLCVRCASDTRWMMSIPDLMRRLMRRSAAAPAAPKSLLLRMYPFDAKRTPDPNTVGLALVTVPSAANMSSRKRR